MENIIIDRIVDEKIKKFSSVRMLERQIEILEELYIFKPDNQKIKEMLIDYNFRLGNFKKASNYSEKFKGQTKINQILKEISLKVEELNIKFKSEYISLDDINTLEEQVKMIDSHPVYYILILKLMFLAELYKRNSEKLKSKRNKGPIKNELDRLEQGIREIRENLRKYFDQSIDFDKYEEYAEYVLSME